MFIMILKCANKHTQHFQLTSLLGRTCWPCENILYRWQNEAV